MLLEAHLLEYSPAFPAPKLLDKLVVISCYHLILISLRCRNQMYIITFPIERIAVFGGTPPKTEHDTTSTPRIGYKHILVQTKHFQVSTSAWMSFLLSLNGGFGGLVSQPVGVLCSRCWKSLRYPQPALRKSTQFFVTARLLLTVSGPPLQQRAAHRLDLEPNLHGRNTANAWANGPASEDF